MRDADAPRQRVAAQLSAVQATLDQPQSTSRAGASCATINRPVREGRT